MPPKMDVKEKFFAQMERELAELGKEQEMLPEPIDDVEAFLNCARYNEEDDGQLLREYLKKHPTDVDARDSQGRTTVHMAAANGHMPILAMLFEFAPTPDVASAEGNTALHFAALNNHVEAAKRLIERGWKASAVNTSNRTSLQLIQGKRFEEMEALLLEHDESLDSYRLPNGATVNVSATDEDDDLEVDGSDAEEQGNEEVPQQPQPPAGARAAAKRPAKAASAAPAKQAPRASPAKKVDEGVLGTSSLDGVE